jgi:hypothetical protein
MHMRLAGSSRQLPDAGIFVKRSTGFSMGVGARNATPIIVAMP